MTDINKQAYDAAQQEHQNKEKEYIKKIVLGILEQLDNEEKNKRKSEERIKYLRKQLDYLKEGKLENLEEMEKVIPDYNGWSTFTVIPERLLSTPTYWKGREVPPTSGSYTVTSSYGSVSVNGRKVKEWFTGPYRVGDNTILF